MWGDVEYTSEIDFREVVEPDGVYVSIYLKESKFRKLTELISSKSLTSFSVHIRGVEGFYSHWSPSITTNLVKVLTKEHKVDIPKDCKIKPPRTGQIRELGLYPGSSQEFVINQDLGIDENDEEDDPGDYNEFLSDYDFDNDCVFDNDDVDSGEGFMCMAVTYSWDPP